MALGSSHITTTSVKREIGETFHRVVSLCTSSKINIFSKWKPIWYNKIGDLTLSDLQLSKFGIDIPIITSMNSSTNWLYSKPVSSSPNRIGDFRNYDHAAPIALSHLSGRNLTINRFSGASYGVTFNVPKTPTNKENYWLSVADLIPQEASSPLYNSVYFGGAVYNGTTRLDNHIYYSTKKMLYNEDNDMEGRNISLSNLNILNSGSYSLRLFLSTTTDPNQNPILEKMYPIYSTYSSPNSISLNVLSLQQTYELTIVGIRPSGGLWADGLSDDFKLGTINTSLTGALQTFDVKCSLKNISSTYTQIRKDKIIIHWKEYTNWDYNYTNRTKSLENTSSVISLAPNASTDIVFSSLKIAPNYISSTPVTLNISPLSNIVYVSAIEPFINNLPNLTLQYTSG